VADLAINTPPNPYTAFQSPDAPSRSNASAQWLAVVTETTARPADRNPAANNGDADGPGGVPVTRLLSMSEQQLLDYIDEKMAEARSAGTPADRERALDDALNAAYAWRAQGGTNDGFDRVRAQLVDSGADKTYVNVVQRRADQVVASGASDFIRPLNNAGDNFGAPLQELQRAIDNDPDHAESNGLWQRGPGSDYRLRPTIRAAKGGLARHLLADDLLRALVLSCRKGSRQRHVHWRGQHSAWPLSDVAAVEYAGHGGRPADGPRPTRGCQPGREGKIRKIRTVANAPRPAPRSGNRRNDECFFQHRRRVFGQ
jgi:hypothetical protein